MPGFLYICADWPLNWITLNVLYNFHIFLQNCPSTSSPHNCPSTDILAVISDLLHPTAGGIRSQRQTHDCPNAHLPDHPFSTVLAENELALKLLPLVTNLAETGEKTRERGKMGSVSPAGAGNRVKVIRSSHSSLQISQHLWYWLS